LHPGSHWLEH
jgi:hypothetical protein